MGLYVFSDVDDAEEKVLARIDELRRELRFYLHEPRVWLGSLRRLSLARNMQGSNSIEGIYASLDDAVDLAAGDEPVDADEQTKLALEGYRRAMTYVLGLAADRHFVYDAGVIRALHYMLVGQDIHGHPGRWRPGGIFVRNEGAGRVVYEGPAAELVPSLCEELIADLNRPMEHHPFLHAAMAHLNLVKIHPFRDGNGRMSRVLQTLVLAREGTADPIFSSIEEYLGRHTEEYYSVLGEVGGEVWSPHRDTRPWVRFCLTAHLRVGTRTQRRIREAEALWTALEQVAGARRLPERLIVALNLAARGLRVRNSTYRVAVGDQGFNDQMASRDLRAGVRTGLLEPQGESRGRTYRGSQELRDLWAQVRLSRDTAECADPFADI